jgi:8-oxo-dGTP pyrophosphatase MutT (NUDIX family)
VLLVVPVSRPTSWNFPGGNYDKLKDIVPGDTALREAIEESGLDIDRSKITESKNIGFMEFPKNQLAKAINQIWSFAVPGLSNLPLNPPPHEILKAEWVNYEEIKNSSGKLNGLTLGDEIKWSVIAAINGLGAEKIVDKGWMRLYLPKIPDNL